MNEHFLSELFNSLNDYIVWSQPLYDQVGEQVIDFNVVFVNDAAARYLNSTKEELQGSRLLQNRVLDDERKKLVFEQMLRVYTTGEEIETTYDNPALNSVLHVRRRMLQDGVLSITREYSKETDTQKKLKKSIEQLNAVFNSSLSGMFTFSPEFNEEGEVVDFRFVIVNRTLAGYVGQEPALLEGDLGSRWFPGYLTNGVFAMYKHTYLTGETQRQNIHYNVDGLDIYLDLMSTKIEDGVLVTFTDHTQLKLLQIALEQKIGELERSNTLLEDFAHAASHDLKEPVRKIMFYADLLRKQFGELLTNESSRIFDRLEVATKRMTQLIDDLLIYSHVSSQSQRNSPNEQIDLNVKLARVIDDLDFAIQESNAKITAVNLPVIKGHRHQLQQLFQNLLSNAIKYRKPGSTPEITIDCPVVSSDNLPFEVHEAEKNKYYYEISISDKGIGFDPKYAGKIFQVFQRLHGNHEYKGSGVGLSIAQKVMENHKGFITAESEEGKGATFKVYFPTQS